MFSIGLNFNVAHELIDKMLFWSMGSNPRKWLPYQHYQKMIPLQAIPSTYKTNFNRISNSFYEDLFSIKVVEKYDFLFDK